jgi:hypothetical protein
VAVEAAKERRTVIQFELLHPRMTEEDLGFLPAMLSVDDKRPARQQFDQHYQHGGGWRAMPGFILTDNNGLKYPGDPIMHPVAQTKLRDEKILIYPYAWVVIVQPDRSFEACRMD